MNCRSRYSREKERERERERDDCNLFLGIDEELEIVHTDCSAESCQVAWTANRPSMLSDSLHFIGFHQWHVNYLPSKSAIVIDLSLKFVEVNFKLSDTEIIRLAINLHLFI